MDALILFFTWLLDNLQYLLLVLTVLFLWDVIDFYVELGHLRFLTRIFALYYITRAFFSISTMEMSIALGIVNTDKKIFVAFVTPLIFSAVLQNLVVKIGGEGSARFDLSKLFDDFRKRILESIIHRNIMEKVKFQTEIIDSKIPTNEIERICQLYAPTADEFNKLRNALSGYSELEKRIEYTKQLIEWGKIESAKELLRKKPKSSRVLHAC